MNTNRDQPQRVRRHHAAVRHRNRHHAEVRRPRRALFKAYTTPELVRRWWGYAEDEWNVCEIDLRVGGTWRYVATHTNENGSFDVGFHGTYKEIDAPHRLVSTEMYEGAPDPTGDGTLNTLTFEETTA